MTYDYDDYYYGDRESSNEDYEDFEDVDFDDEEGDIMYEVWILGLDNDDNVVDFECLAETFDDANAAKDFAEELRDDILDNRIDVRDDYSIPYSVEGIEIRVESTRVVDGEYTENIDTIFTSMVRI